MSVLVPITLMSIKLQVKDMLLNSESSARGKVCSAIMCNVNMTF